MGFEGLTRAGRATSFFLAAANMASGLNTEIEHAGRVYHVQTQEAERHGRAVETLVYLNGAVLVRMTVSWSELEARGELSDTDVRHVLELQHFDIIRKIRHGMLDGSDATPVETPTPSPPPIPAESEAFLRELLEELEL